MTGRRPHRILITRPREEAERLAADLATRGFDCMIEPMLDIRLLPGPALDLEDVQAFLFTSANGVRAAAARTGRRDIPVLAVGDATARAAREAGFHSVLSAAGDVDSLAELVVARCDPEAGTLLHAAGSAVAGDLAGRLEPYGFRIDRQVLYVAEPAEALSESTAERLYAGTIDAVLFFSPRTARSFVTLVERTGLAGRLATVAALCLSEAVARAARTVAWREVRVARRPDQPALMELLDHV